MSAVAPAALVAGAVRAPLPFGLFPVVQMRPDSGDRWESGVEWERLICDMPGAIGPWQKPPTDTSGLPKSLPRNGQGTGEAEPFTVYGHFRCSPVGWSVDAAEKRAAEHLMTREEAAAEHAFWTGAIGNTPSLAGVDTTLAGGTAVAPNVGVALMEDHLGGQYGSLGAIHVTRGTATRMLASKLLEVRGGRLLTKLGTPVVAGAGYPGTGPGASPAPAAGTAWAYSSAALFGYRSEVFTSSNVAGDLLDRGRNDLYAIAERSYLIGADPCGGSAVLIDLDASA